MRDSTLDQYKSVDNHWKMGIALTFDRKKRTRAEGSKGIRPDTVNDRVLAAINLATLVRSTCSPSKSGWALRTTDLLGYAGDRGARSISKSDMLGLLLNGSAWSRLL